MSKKELLIMLPAFNEEECLEPLLKNMCDSGIFEFADVLVINDGSEDNTSVVAKENGARVITHIYNLGYGCALQTGYKFAVRHSYNYVIQMDSDGQHDICNIESIYNQLKDENAPDIVMGSRFFDSSVTFHIPIVKKIPIAFFRFLIKKSTGQEILDPTSGLQGLNRDAFLYYSKFNQFVYDFPDANMIIQMLLNDFRIAEVPSVMHRREIGTSMHSGLKPIMYILKMVLNVTVVIIRERVNKRKKK